MEPSEIRAHASRIIAIHNSDVSYSLVYEDDDLEGAEEDDLLAVHAAINRARVTAEWDD